MWLWYLHYIYIVQELQQIFRMNENKTPSAIIKLCYLTTTIFKKVISLIKQNRPMHERVKLFCMKLRFPRHISVSKHYYSGAPEK